MAVRKKLGEILVEQGSVTAELVKRGLGHQRQWGGKIGRILVEMKHLSEEQLARALAAQSRMPLAKMKPDIPASVTALIPADLAEKHQAVAFGIRTVDKVETVYVAIADPFNVPGMDELRFRIGKTVKFALAPADEIARAIASSQGIDTDSSSGGIALGAPSAEEAKPGGMPVAPRPVSADPFAGMGRPEAPAAPTAGDPLAEFFAPTRPETQPVNDLDALLGLAPPAPAAPASRPSSSGALDDLFDVGSVQGPPAPRPTAAAPVVRFAPPQLARPVSVPPVVQAPVAQAPIQPSNDFSFDLGTPAEALAALSASTVEGESLDVPDDAPLELESGAEALLSDKYAPEPSSPETPAVELELSEAEALPGVELSLEDAEQVPAELDALQVGELETASTDSLDAGMLPVSEVAQVELLPGAPDDIPDVAAVAIEDAEILPLESEEAASAGEMALSALDGSGDAPSIERGTGDVASEGALDTANSSASGLAFDVLGSVAGEDLMVSADAFGGEPTASSPAAVELVELDAGSVVEEQPGALSNWDLDANAVAVDEPPAEAESSADVGSLGFAMAGTEVDAPAEAAFAEVNPGASCDVDAPAEAPTWELDAAAIAEQPVVPAEAETPSFDLDAAAISEETPSPAEAEKPSWDLDAAAIAEDPAGPAAAETPSFDLDAAEISEETPSPAEAEKPSWDLDAAEISEETASPAEAEAFVLESRDLDFSEVAPVSDASPDAEASSLPEDEVAVVEDAAGVGLGMEASESGSGETEMAALPAIAADAAEPPSPAIEDGPLASDAPDLDVIGAESAIEAEPEQPTAAWELGGIAEPASPGLDAFSESADYASANRATAGEMAAEEIEQLSADAGANGLELGIYELQPAADAEVLPETSGGFFAAAESTDSFFADGVAPGAREVGAAGGDPVEQPVSALEDEGLAGAPSDVAFPDVLAGPTEEAMPDVHSQQADERAFADSGLSEDESASAGDASLEIEASGDRRTSLYQEQGVDEAGEPPEEHVDSPVAEAVPVEPLAHESDPQVVSDEGEFGAALEIAAAGTQEESVGQTNFGVSPGESAETPASPEQDLDFSSLLDDGSARQPAYEESVADVPVPAPPEADSDGVQSSNASDSASWTVHTAVDALGEPTASGWSDAAGAAVPSIAQPHRHDGLDDEIAIPLADGSVFEPAAEPVAETHVAPTEVFMAAAEQSVEDPLFPALVASLKRVAEGLPPADAMPIPTERLSKAVVKLLLDMGAITPDDLVEMLAITPEKLSASTVKILMGQGFIGAEDILSMLAIPVDRLNATVLVMMLERGVFDAQRVLKALR